MPHKTQSSPKGTTQRPASSSKNNKRKAQDDMDDDVEVNGVDAAGGQGASSQQGKDQTTREDWPYDDLLRAAVEPMTRKNIDAWGGWCELESEPAFFTSLVSDYGVRNVKIEEIFAFDDASLIHLPRPIFGLVLLHECIDTAQEDATVDDDDSKQTVDNACATIALINIIMNCPQIQFGPELQKFKDATKDVSSPLKGHAIGVNKFLRKHHNSLVRRIDVLNSDLSAAIDLDKFSVAQKKRKTPAKKKQKTAPKNKKRRKFGTNGYHYVAFVEANGWVWQLDGLQAAPVKLKQIRPGGSVVSVARDYITPLVAQYGGSVRFSSMALCQSPHATATAQLAQTVAHLEEVSMRSDDDDKLRALLETGEKPSVTLKDTAALLKYGLAKEAIEQLTPEASFLEKVSDDTTTPEELHRMYNDLVLEQKMYIAAQRDEIAAQNRDRANYEARKCDALAMINRWVSALAAHGKLEKLVNEQIDKAKAQGARG